MLETTTYIICTLTAVVVWWWWPCIWWALSLPINIYIYILFIYINLLESPQPCPSAPMSRSGYPVTKSALCQLRTSPPCLPVPDRVRTSPPALLHHDAKTNGGTDFKRARRTGPSARRARRTKSRGPKGLQQEVGTRRGP